MDTSLVGIIVLRAIRARIMNRYYADNGYGTNIKPDAIRKLIQDCLIIRECLQLLGAEDTASFSH